MIVHKAACRIAETMAVLGALVLSFLILMTCTSVLGRELNAILNSDFFQNTLPGFSRFVLDTGVGPILGDFELLENMMAFAIFAFLPIAQIQSSHATVDVFTSKFPPQVLVWMRAVTEVVFAFVLIIFAYQLFEGTQAKMRYNETTYLIQFPVWWAFAGALVAACVAALIGIYMAGARIVEALSGREIQDSSGGADH